MELFAFATVWFWMLVVLASIVILIALEGEKGWLATLTVVAFVLVVHYWGGINVIEYMKSHPLRVLAGAAGYFAAGTVWSLIKWWFYVRSQRNRCREALDAFEQDWPTKVVVETLPYKLKNDLDASGAPDAGAMVDQMDRDLEKKKKEDPEYKKKLWSEYTREGEYKDIRFVFKPDPRNHVRVILAWMTYWPWSLVWTLINDPIRKAFNMIFRKLSRVFSGISEGAFKGMDVK